MAVIEKNIRIKKKKGSDIIISYPQTVDTNILVDGKTKKLSDKLSEYIPSRWNNGKLEVLNGIAWEPAGLDSAVYDVVIRTQEEFIALYSSSNWLGASSVAFIGNGGPLKFTRSTTGLKIPQTVKQIKGFNSAKIEITEFAYDSSSNKAGLWYATLPATADYSIQDIEVSVTGTTGAGNAFHSCTGLTNCAGTGTGAGAGSGAGFASCNQLTNCIGAGSGTATSTAFNQGFVLCNQLTNCTGTGTGGGSTSSRGIGFQSCTLLINCTGIGNVTVAGSCFAFHSCTHVTNCTGTGTGVSASAGFYGCSQLANCTGKGISASEGQGFYSCTHLTNCIGTGTSTNSDAKSSYAFRGCKFLTGCKEGTPISTTAIWGDTWLFRDDDSCQLER